MSEPSAAPSTVGNEVGPQCPPLFSRPTPRAPRPTLGGILPATNGRFVKEQTAPNLDERPHYLRGSYCISGGQLASITLNSCVTDTCGGISSAPATSYKCLL